MSLFPSVHPDTKKPAPGNEAGSNNWKHIMTDTTNKNNNQAPLVSAEIVLTGHHYVPIDIKLVTESELAFLSDAGFRAAITLMLKSWNETPATSLPNDDRLLANLAGFGRGPSALADWAGVKDEALSAFVLCDDGRWYCPAMVGKAEEVHHAVQMRKAKSDAGRAVIEANREAARKLRLQSLSQHAKGDTVTVTMPVTMAATQLNHTELHDTELNDTTGKETTSQHTKPDDPADGSGMISNDCFEPAKAAPGDSGGQVGNSLTMPDQSEATEDSVPPAAKLAPASAVPDPDPVGFEEGVIRFTVSEMEALRRTYLNLHVERELCDLTRWAGRLVEAGKDWRQAIRSTLSKKDKAVEAQRMEMKLAAEANAKAQAAGIYRSPGVAI